MNELNKTLLDLNDVRNWSDDTKFTPEQLELFERLSYIYFNSMKFITPEEMYSINVDGNLTDKERMELRRDIQVGTLKYESGYLNYWSTIRVQTDYNIFFGYISQIKQRTATRLVVTLKNIDNTRFSLLTPDETLLTFQTLGGSNGFEYIFVNFTYIVRSVNPDTYEVTMDLYENGYTGEDISEVRLDNAKVWEAGGFAILVNNSSTDFVNENDKISLQNKIAELTRSIRETGNVDDPAYVKADRWRDYYRVRLAMIYVSEDNLNGYTDGTGDPLPQFIRDVIVTNNKQQSLTNLENLAKEKKALAEKPVKTIDEWIEYLIQRVMYQNSTNIIITFTDNRYDYRRQYGARWNAYDEDYSGEIINNLNTPFLTQVSGRDISSKGTTYNTGIQHSANYLLGYYSGVTGRYVGNFDICNFLGISEELIENYEINITTSLSLIGEINFLDYATGSACKYYVQVSPTSSKRYYTLAIELLAAKNYHGGTIGVDVNVVAKKIN